MNNKFILMFFVILNVMVVSLSVMGGQEVGLYTDAMGALFDFEVGADGSINVSSYNDAVKTETDKFSQGEDGIISRSIGAFYDVFKIVSAFIGLLTPFPIFALMSSLGVVWFVNVLITVPLTILWLIGLYETVRGGQY